MDAIAKFEQTMWTNCGTKPKLVPYNIRGCVFLPWICHDASSNASSGYPLM